MVVLDTLSPAERLAFVLHDMFGVSFEEIGPIVDRNAAAARQLASRARRRVRGADEPGASSLAQQREVVEAFLAASRGGDIEALLEVLDPGVVFRAETDTAGPLVPAVVRGADEVATAVLTRGRPFAHLGRPAIVNGRPGAVVAFPDRVVSLVAFTIVGGRVTEMDLLVDPVKLERMAWSRLRSSSSRWRWGSWAGVGEGLVAERCGGVQPEERRAGAGCRSAPGWRPVSRRSPRAGSAPARSAPSPATGARAATAAARTRLRSRPRARPRSAAGDGRRGTRRAPASTMSG